MRKAQLSVQFNWIFVFIIGVVILAFFLILIRNKSEESKLELSADIIQNLDTISKSAAASVGSVKIINLPKIELTFICEDGLSQYDLGRGVSKETPYDIIFTQEKLKGTRIITWTQSWDLPYRIATFQYLTTPNNLFVIVNDTGSLAEQLYHALPANISKMFIKPETSLGDLGFDHYKIIEFSETGRATFNNIKVDDYHLIKIHVDGDTLDSYGQIDFYPEGEQARYLKKEMLFGAIFAEDIDFYKCTVEKAMKRLDTLINLSIRRAEKLAEGAEDDTCKIILETYAIPEMKDMLTNLNLDDNKKLYDSSKRIANDNENLIRGRNCPLIY